MMLKIFQATGPKGQSFTAKTLLGPITTSSREELDTRIADLRAKAKEILGRELTDDEFTNGPPKPQPTKEQIAESRRQKVRTERATRLEQEAAYSPENQRLETARQRAEQERVAALSPAQRELESAAKAAEEAEQRRIDRAKKDEIRKSSAYLMVRTAVDDLLLIAKLTPDVSEEQLALIESQSHDLETHLDLAATRQNLAQLQKVVSGQLEVRDIELQQANDRAAMRKKLLASGATFDSVDVELVGDLAFVCLTVGDKTVKVSQATYDSRTSDEALRNTLFSGDTTNV